MATVAKFLKEKDPTAKTIFIGPCTAKKDEIKNEKVAPYVDAVMTFEELQAFIDAFEIDMASLPEETYGSYGGSVYGRGFAKCGGLSAAVHEVLKEENIDFEVKGIAVDGPENIKKALNEFKKPNSQYNFNEGMMCVGGCIGGPCNLQHSVRTKIAVEKYSIASSDKTIKETVEKTKE